jgi:hypothetical protein
MWLTQSVSFALARRVQGDSSVCYQNWLLVHFLYSLKQAFIIVMCGILTGHVEYVMKGLSPVHAQLYCSDFDSSDMFVLLE